MAHAARAAVPHPQPGEVSFHTRHLRSPTLSCPRRPRPSNAPSTSPLHTPSPPPLQASCRQAPPRNAHNHRRPACQAPPSPRSKSIPSNEVILPRAPSSRRWSPRRAPSAILLCSSATTSSMRSDPNPVTIRPRLGPEEAPALRAPEPSPALTCPCAATLADPREATGYSGTVAPWRRFKRDPRRVVDAGGASASPEGNSAAFGDGTAPGPSKI